MEGCAMYLKRSVYRDLLEWKKSERQTTLEVTGARQVGKTYIIRKFAEENFKNVIYVNLFELSGKQFQQCYRQATEWSPGQKRTEKPLHEAFKLYDEQFTDDAETVVIIDEIQESAEIYNRIREFTRQFQCRFIVIGSYLGRILEPEFRFSSGDVTKLQVYTLSFKEFLQANDGDLYQAYCEEQDLSNDTLEKISALYHVYTQIGGYPAVVEEFILSGEIVKAKAELVKIIQTFLNESMRYFEDILDVGVYDNIFLSISRILLREKKGLEEDSVSEELQKLVVKDYSSNISKATCYRAMNWLQHSGIIGFCGKVIELDPLDFKSRSRCFFMDVGLAHYYLSRAGADYATIQGILNENYVYINLKKRQDYPEEIAFEMPAFATYKGGEIDFFVQTIGENKKYAVEVKSGKNAGNSAKKALEQGKVDYLLYLKGNTKGGIHDKIITMPIFMIEEYRFEGIPSDNGMSKRKSYK